MRKDARERRLALLEVAETVFAVHGFDVPLAVIAKRASVGRGTLYRNFANRLVLAEALLDKEIARLEVAAAYVADDPAGFFLLFTELASGLRKTALLVEGLRRMGRYKHRDRARRKRVEKLFAGPIRRAQRIGLLRTDVTPSDTLLLASMLIGGTQDAEPKERAHKLERSLELLLEGLRERK